MEPRAPPVLDAEGRSGFVILRRSGWGPGHAVEAEGSPSHVRRSPHIGGTANLPDSRTSSARAQEILRRASIVATRTAIGAQDDKVGAKIGVRPHLRLSVNRIVNGGLTPGSALCALRAQMKNAGVSAGVSVMPIPSLTLRR